MEGEPLKPVKIFIKILPSENSCFKYIRVAQNHRGVYVKSLENVFRKSHLGEDFYEVDKVISNVKMEEEYEEIMGGVLQEVLNGNDVIVLAYGQSRSGKSSTISGLYDTHYEDRGLGPRIGANLLELRSELQRFMKISIQMSYVEVKSYSGNDLLKPFPNRFDFVGLRNVKKINISDEYYLYKYLYKAEGRKDFVNCGYLSNTSTSVLSFYINRINLSYSNKADVHSTIHIIDMAGADTIGKSVASLCKKHIDIGRANVQKSQLEQLFLSFSGNSGEVRIKQRLNILLQYLGESLRPSTIYRLICHLQTTSEDLGTIHSMLKLFLYAQKIKTQQKSITSKTLNVIDQLKLTIEDLKTEKFHTKMFRYKEYCELLNKERVAQIQQVIEEYILGTTSEITIFNVTYVDLALKMFKELYYKERADNESHLKRVYDKAYSDAVNSLKARKEKKPMDTSSKQSTLTSSKTSKQSTVTSSKSSKMSSKSSASKGSRSIENKSVTGSKRSNESKSNSPSKPSIESPSPETKPASKESSIGPKTSGTSVTLSEGKRRTKQNGQTPSRVSSSKLPAAPLAEFHDTKSRTTTPTMALPEMLPEHSEMWETYIREENTGYQYLLSMYLENVRLARDVSRQYSNELTKLSDLISVRTTRKDELLQAGVTTRLTESEKYDENGELILSRWEMLCKQNLEKVEEDVQEQQEIVLAAHAKLRMFLGQIGQIKRDIAKDFEEYCLKTFNIPASCITEITEFEEKTIASQMLGEDITLEGRHRLMNKSKGSYQTKDTIMVDHMDEYKYCMEEEMKKKKQYELSRRSWK